MRKVRIQGLAAVAAGLLLVAGIALSNVVSATVPDVNEAVDSNTSGSAPNGGANIGPSISQNGRYIAFSSAATNLVSGTTVSGAYSEVYVRDRLHNTTSLVSMSSSGTPADASSYYQQISANGRYVVFASTADNLTSDSFASPADNFYHIFRHDMETGTTVLVDTNSGGVLNADSSSTNPSVSADGNYVVFQSNSSNSTSLVSSPTLTAYREYVFEKDIATGAVTLLSDGTSNTNPNGSSYTPTIDCGGDEVAFESLASNLVSGDTNGNDDVFLRNMLTGDTSDLTASGNGGSYSASISCNGEYVGVLSYATNLNADTIGNSVLNAYAYDRIDQIFVTLSKSSGGSLANDSTTSLSISDDGKFATFSSPATNLASNATDGTSNVYLRNVEAGSTELVSSSSGGAEGNGASYNPVISTDDRYIAFSSLASNLITGYSLSGQTLTYVSQSGAADDY